MEQQQNIQIEPFPADSTLGAGKQKRIPQEQLQREADYERAQKMLVAMLKRGLITLSEFYKITELNRITFSPMWAGILPSSRCYHTRPEVICHADEEVTE